MKMDVDGDIVDQQLLQQFSCMGTTDKDELIKQMQVLVGNHLNSSSARFFLDMNNWNLQAAVGSYFDFDTPAKLPFMSLLRDDINSDSLNLLPSTAVQKVWVLLNTGDEAWPEGCCLQFSGGDIMSDTKRVLVEAVAPNKTTHVTIQLVAPQRPGMYQSKWRMATPAGAYFGDIIWIIMSVIERETNELAQQLAHLSTIGGSSHSQRPDTSSIVNPFGRQHHQLCQEHPMQDGENKMC